MDPASNGSLKIVHAFQNVAESRRSEGRSKTYLRIDGQDISFTSEKSESSQFQEINTVFKEKLAETQGMSSESKKDILHNYKNITQDYKNKAGYLTYFVLWLCGDEQAVGVAEADRMIADGLRDVKAQQKEYKLSQEKPLMTEKIIDLRYMKMGGHSIEVRETSFYNEKMGRREVVIREYCPTKQDYYIEKEEGKFLPVEGESLYEGRRYYRSGPVSFEEGSYIDGILKKGKREYLTGQSFEGEWGSSWTGSGWAVRTTSFEGTVIYPSGIKEKGGFYIPDKAPENPRLFPSSDHPGSRSYPQGIEIEGYFDQGCIRFEKAWSLTLDGLGILSFNPDPQDGTRLSLTWRGLTNLKQEGNIILMGDGANMTFTDSSLLVSFKDKKTGLDYQYGYQKINNEEQIGLFKDGELIHGRKHAIGRFGVSQDDFIDRLPSAN